VDFFVLTGWIAGVLGVLLALVGIFLTVRARQTPDLRTARDYDLIVPEGGWMLRGGLQITFEGRSLDRVARTYIAIWNHRGKTVKGTEVLASDPLRIEVSEGDEVLHARVVAQSRPQIGVDVAPMGRTANVTFDFMDARDGAVIEIIHSGEQPANLVGTIPGAKLSGIRREVLSPEGRRRLRRNPISRIFVNGGLPGFALATGLVFYLFGSIYFGARALWPEMGVTVDPDDYRLTTYDGQQEFASAVLGTGAYFGAPLVAAVCAFFFAATTIMLVLRFGLGRVPQRVVRADTDPDSDDLIERVRAARRLGSG
jgi:hypothetical protein